VKPTIRSSALCGYSDLAISLGLDPLRMILDIGLPGGSLSQSDLMLAVDRVCVLLELSAERADQMAFGLALAQNRRLSHLGEFGLILRDQPTLGHMARASENYSRLHNNALIFAIEEEGEYSNIYMETRVDADIPTRQFSEFLVGSTFKICQTIFGDASREMQVCFRHGAPPDLREHIRFFGAKPLFNFEFNGFVYKSSLLNQINSHADPAFSQYTLSLIQAIRSPATPASHSDEVRRVVMQLLPRGECSAERVAACLGVDRRTVSRQLARENQSFSSLIDSVRQELSVRYVLESDLPIGDIAPLLGFRSASALVTWYRKHFGQSPMQHRRQHACQAAKTTGLLRP